MLGFLPGIYTSEVIDRVSGGIAGGQNQILPFAFVGRHFRPKGRWTARYRKAKV